MIPISAACEIVKRETPRLAVETIGLDSAVNRVLAQDIFADMDLPPFNRSQMDGYACKASDTHRPPVRLKIVGESAAGKSWAGEIRVGEAIRIMTGAAVPAGASAVQKLEVCEEKGDFVEIMESAVKGQNIVARASEIQKGAKLFSQGEIIRSNMIAGLAAFGYAEIEVGTRPRVAIISTGNEIVAVDETPSADQIRNSNTPMLRVLAAETGAAAETLPIVGDEIENLKSKIQNPNCDVLILTGGVSVGKYDLTKAALREVGAEIFFEKVALKPGKPTVFARLGERLIFALPGNPVSAAVTFQIFVRPALRQMQGASDGAMRSGRAVLSKPLRGARGRDSFVPARLVTDDNGRLIAEPLKYGGSSDFVGFSRTDALVFVPQNKSLGAGAAAEVFFLGGVGSDE